MKTKILLLFSVGIFFMAPLRSEEPQAHAIDDALRNVRTKQKIVLQGKIVRPFDFEQFLLEDNTGRIAVSFVGVKQSLKAGDQVVVYGRFMGRLTYANRYGLMEVLEWAFVSDPRAAELRQKYGVVASTATENTPVVATPAKSVESRLKELDDLKTKKLISPDEYKEQRKRILGDL